MFLSLFQEITAEELKQRRLAPRPARRLRWPGRAREATPVSPDDGKYPPATGADGRGTAAAPRAASCGRLSERDSQIPRKPRRRALSSPAETRRQNKLFQSDVPTDAALYLHARPVEASERYKRPVRPKSLLLFASVGNEPSSMPQSGPTGTCWLTLKSHQCL